MTQTVDHFTLETFALMLVFSIVVAIPIARRTAGPWWQMVLAFASVAGILAVTLVGRVRKLSPFNIGQWSVDWLHDGDSWRHALDVDREWLLNVALFVPAGALISHVTRSPFVAFAGLVVGCLAIELVQRRYGLGAADPADLLANTAGAGIGALVGQLARRVGNRQKPAADAVTLEIFFHADPPPGRLVARASRASQDDRPPPSPNRARTHPVHPESDRRTYGASTRPPVCRRSACAQLFDDRYQV